MRVSFRLTQTACAALTALALWLGCMSERARAQAPAGLTLEWRAPSVCPTQQAVAREIEAVLGASTHADRALQVRVTVTQRPTGFRAELEFSGADVSGATRTLQDPDCDALAKASALVIAIAIDPGVVERAASTTTMPAEPKRVEEPAASTSTADADAHAAARDAQPGPGSAASPVTFEVGASLLLHSGMLPFFAEGVAGGLALRFVGVRTELSGFVLPAQLEQAPQTARVATHLSLVGGALRVGYDFPIGAWSLGPVLGAQWLTVSGQARGAGALSAQGSDISVALDAGATLAWQLLSWLSVRMSGRLGMPLTRRRFVVLNLGRVHEPDVLTESLELGLFVQTR
jgi:hypothetical protein